MLAAVTAFMAAFWAFPARAEMDAAYKTVILTGGNFWYLESAFDRVPGVMKARSGYTGGQTTSPTFQTVTNGGSGHKMAVEVAYDPKIVSFEKILDIYWHSIDPTDQGGQFCDRGDQYLSIIYYKTSEEKRAAQKSLIGVASDLSDNGIATRIVEAKEFFPAEDYHQDYHKKENYKYKFNRKRCRVDEMLKDVWGWDANTEE